ncbi:MAG TPA: hypothetical protein DCE41_38020, partial [Cytophagales bacterium]|nr:hypothetical protein [Cytophagales bacterium]
MTSKKLTPYFPLASGWRLVLAAGFVLFVFGFIYLNYLFDEPPGFDLTVVLLLILMGWATWEVIHQFLRRTRTRGLWRILWAVGLGVLTFDALYFVLKWVDHWVLGSEPPLLFHMLFSTVMGGLVSAVVT